VCERTAADKKGGHLARRKADGKYMLRESAMCPDADKAAFEDISLHKYFNTNNLWVNLPLLKVGGVASKREGGMGRGGGRSGGMGSSTMRRGWTRFHAKMAAACWVWGTGRRTRGGGGKCKSGTCSAC
jgi:hypothetical protein